MKISLALAIIPAFFGILGIGLIYQDSRDYRGWKFLAAGAVLYILPVITLMIGFTTLIGAVLLLLPVFFALLLYAGAALVSIAETYFGSFRLIFR